MKKFPNNFFLIYSNLLNILLIIYIDTDQFSLSISVTKKIHLTFMSKNIVLQRDTTGKKSKKLYFIFYFFLIEKEKAKTTLILVCENVGALLISI
jgi:flagellar biosynthesis regulator FlbT